MLKQLILKYKTRQNIKKRDCNPSVSFADSKKIAIVYSDQFEAEENIQEVINELNQSGKEISTLVFCHQPKKKTTSLPHFSAGDISFSGDIVKPELEGFLQQTYDFAICFDESNHILIDYIISLVNARCKIGITEPHRNQLFEMMVSNPGGDENRLSSEVVRYLKMIQYHE